MSLSLKVYAEEVEITLNRKGLFFIEPLNQVYWPPDEGGLDLLL